MTTTIEAAWSALEQLTDPEIPVISLRELGILRDVRHGPEGLEVVITPTYSGCPAMGQIEDDVRSTLETAGISARVITQLAPAWTTDWIAADARQRMREFGIAPPGSAIAGAAPVDVRGISPLRRADVVVPCPRCGSARTRLTAQFGSTACKALYRCDDCLEPFDYFKPH